MKEEELQAIRERAGKATSGPWSVLSLGDNRELLLTAQGNGILTKLSRTIPIHDEMFIAHARKDVPKLLDEIERLRGSLSYIQKYVQRAGLEDTPAYEIIAIVHAKVCQALDGDES